MIIPFSLNGVSVKTDVPPHKRSVHVLTENFQCRSLKHQCCNSECGSCLILLDERPVLSCLLPAFELRFRSIWTMEGLSNKKGYADILGGFKESHIQLCPLCAPARALAAEALLGETLRPVVQQLQETMESVKCDCSSTPRILNAIIRSARHREKRINDT